MLLKRLTLPIREEFVSATFVSVWHTEKWEAEGALALFISVYRSEDKMCSRTVCAVEAH